MYRFFDTNSSAILPDPDMLLSYSSVIPGSVPGCSDLFLRISTNEYTSNMASGRIQKAIQQKIQTALKPTHLEIINESYMHNVPQNSETHFKVRPFQMHSASGT